MNLELENSIVLITGATGSIGGDIAADFLKEGAVVICLIRNQKKMDDLRNSLIEQGVKCDQLYAETCDLNDNRQIKDVVKTITEKFKRIDILINCAGFAHEYPFGLLSEDQIEQMVKVNFVSPMLLTQAVLKPMLKQKEGSIVNVSSVSAAKKGRGITVYAAAKAAVESFTRTLAIEVGRRNVRVNCVRPGVVETPMSKPLMDRAGEEVLAAVPLGRIAKPSEISKVVVFVASNAVNPYMSGETIAVDGGMY